MHSNTPIKSSVNVIKFNMMIIYIHMFLSSENNSYSLDINPPNMSLFVFIQWDNRMTCKLLLVSYFSSLDSVLMSSLTVASSEGYILPSLANVKFSRVALKLGGQKSAQVRFEFPPSNSISSLLFICSWPTSIMKKMLDTQFKQSSKIKLSIYHHLN